ncbi:30133_t:CDS:1, partial [Racocetra persica]
STNDQSHLLSGASLEKIGDGGSSDRLRDAKNEPSFCSISPS